MNSERRNSNTGRALRAELRLRKMEDHFTELMRPLVDLSEEVVVNRKRIEELEKILLDKQAVL